MADPWFDVVIESQSGSFEDDFRPFLKMPDSKAYISLLESKLSRLKGSEASRLTSGKVIDELLECKDDHMSHLMSSRDFPAAFSVEDTNVGRQDTTTINTILPSFLRQKLYPDREALSVEELQSLVLADHLQESSVAQTNDTAQSTPRPDSKERL